MTDMMGAASVDVIDAAGHIPVAMDHTFPTSAVAPVLPCRWR
jgi:hypothetical protein